MKKHGASGSKGVPYRPYKFEHLMMFLDGMKGEDQMEGNLDESTRQDDISDEVGVDAMLPLGDELENEDDDVDGDLSQEASDVNENGGDNNAMDWSIKNELADASLRERKMDAGGGIGASSTPSSGRIPLRPIQFNDMSPSPKVCHIFTVTCTRTIV